MALLRALRSTVFLGGAYLLLRSASGEGTAGSLAVAAVLGIALLYLVGSFLDGAEFTPEGRAWVWFQNSQVPKWFVGPRGYCPGAIVYDDKEALKAVDQCIFAAFPHGVISLHHTLTTSDAVGFCSEFPKLSGERRRDLAASVVFMIPLWRELLLWLGCVDAGRKTAHGVLKKGWSLYILPGGEMEQMLTREGEHHLYLKKRKGFVKLALQYGVPLVPVYNFGETDMYTTYSWMLAARMWICKNLRVAIPLVRGIGPTILPRRVPLTCIIGKPITVKKDPEPTPAAVDALHEVFEAALRELFDKHKSKHARDGAELVIH